MLENKLVKENSRNGKFVSNMTKSEWYERYFGYQEGELGEVYNSDNNFAVADSKLEHQSISSSTNQPNTWYKEKV